MALQRTVAPEHLDGIPPYDPRAVRSRRDLQRLNALMLHAKVMAKLLTWSWQDECTPRLIVELGGGDGSLMVGIAKRLSQRWPGVTALTVDRCNVVQDTTRRQVARFGWSLEPVTADIFEYLKNPMAARPDIILTNLFLHHFPDDALSRVLSGSAGATRAFVACEPRRSAATLIASRLVFAMGANDVTRHDAVVSVRAGFRDQEISDYPGTVGILRSIRATFHALFRRATNKRLQGSFTRLKPSRGRVSASPCVATRAEIHLRSKQIIIAERTESGTRCLGFAELFSA